MKTAVCKWNVIVFCCNLEGGVDSREIYYRIADIIAVCTTVWNQSKPTSGLAASGNKLQKALFMNASAKKSAHTRIRVTTITIIAEPMNG